MTLLYVANAVTWSLASAVIGYRVAKVKYANKKPVTKYVCSCGHYYNEHTKNGKGTCNVTTVRLRDDEVKNKSSCPCLFYLGPKPDPSPEDILNLFNKDNERDTKSDN